MMSWYINYSLQLAKYYNSYKFKVATLAYATTVGWFIISEPAYHHKAKMPLSPGFTYASHSFTLDGLLHTASLGITLLPVAGFNTPSVLVAIYQYGPVGRRRSKRQPHILTIRRPHRNSDKHMYGQSPMPTCRLILISYRRILLYISLIY